MSLLPDVTASGVQPKHLLWTLLFLKTYATEPILCALVGGVDEKTFRTKVWFLVCEIALLADHLVSKTTRLLLNPLLVLSNSVSIECCLVSIKDCLGKPATRAKRPSLLDNS